MVSDRDTRHYGLIVCVVCIFGRVVSVFRIRLTVMDSHVQSRELRSCFCWRLGTGGNGLGFGSRLWILFFLVKGPPAAKRKTANSVNNY